MKTSTVVWILIAFIIIGAGAYWWLRAGQIAAGAPASGSAGAASSTQSVAMSEPSFSTAYVSDSVLLSVASSSALGSYLVADNGMTLYYFDKDNSGATNCTGQCAVVWPPYTVDSSDALTNVGAGVAGHIGALTRADGSLQVTYDGQPLYFYTQDQNPGDTKGQGVDGSWFVVAP